MAVVWTGDNLAEVLRAWAASTSYAIRVTNGPNGPVLHTRQKVGGWPKDPIVESDYTLVEVGDAVG